MEKIPLTEKQSAVYRFLAQRQSGGLPPTVREICRATGIKSTSSVHGILTALEQNGYILRDAHHSRAIRIAETAETVQVPVLGRVTAGQPILAIEEIEDYIPYPARAAEGLFALRVVGLSMRDAGILDGDVVVADRTLPGREGDIVIGMDGDEATVKRLHFEADGTVVFLPENPDFSPIYPAQPSVLGRVVGCLRRY